MRSVSSASGSQTTTQQVPQTIHPIITPHIYTLIIIFHCCVEVKGRQFLVPAGKVKWLKIPSACPSTAFHSSDLRLTKSAVRSDDLLDGFLNQSTFHTRGESADWQLPGQVITHTKLSQPNLAVIIFDWSIGSVWEPRSLTRNILMSVEVLIHQVIRMRHCDFCHWISSLDF